MTETPEIIGPLSLLADIERLWDEGMPPGDRTGWASLDKHYTVAPGHVTIVTGWPSSGKSEWLDALLVHLMDRKWRISIFSPENQPASVHGIKYLEKISGMPFGPGPTARIPRENLVHLAMELAGKLQFIVPPEDASLSVKQVIEAATPFLDGAEAKGQKRGLVIDPWNELEHWRPPGLSETEYISKTLSYLRNWARRTATHTWLVAHPRNIRRDESGKLPVPRPDMISGSQHWWNKADVNITVWRSLDDPDSQDVDVHVQKVRFKHIGRPGLITLKYDRITGRYHEPPVNLYDVKRK